MARILDRLMRSPKYLVLALIAIALPLALAQSSSNGGSGSSGSTSGGSSSGKVDTFTIKEKDYSFTPDQMTWHVGEKIKLKVINTSKDDAHMFMMGKDPHYTKTKFGKRYPKGWNTPLFTKPGQVTYHMGKDVLTENPKPGGTLQEGGFELAKGSMDGATPHVVITFTVPNKPGTWHFACFEQKGQHFTSHHMEGTIKIVK